MRDQAIQEQTEEVTEWERKTLSHVTAFEAAITIKGNVTDRVGRGRPRMHRPISAQVAIGYSDGYTIEDDRIEAKIRNIFCASDNQKSGIYIKSLSGAVQMDILSFVRCLNDLNKHTIFSDR